MSEEKPQDAQTPETTPETAPETAPEKTEPQLPEFGFSVEDAGTLKKKVAITVPRGRIEAKYNEMFGELSKSAQVPGFRVGHAPRRLIEKRFGKEVGSDVRNAVVSEALQQSVEKVKLNTIGEPDLDLDKIELPEQGDMTFSFEIEVAPEFELPTLEGIEVKKPKIEITDERINDRLEEWRSSQARFEASEEAAAAGDVVNADVKITGEGIGEHKHDAQVLRVAAGQVEGIPLVELGNVLAGKKVGDSAQLKVTVPEAHPNEAWRGKEATIDLTLVQIRKRVLPEINDELAKNMGYESLTELRDSVRKNLESRLETEVRQEMQGQISKYLLDNTKFDVPEGMANRHASTVLQRRYVDLLYRGVPREKIDENLAQLQAAAAEQALVDLKLQFILAKAAEKFEITVDEAEVNSRIASMAAEYNRRPERMKQELQEKGTLAEVEISIREDRTLSKLLESAKVTEITPEELAAAAKAQQEEAAAKAEGSSEEKK